MKYSIFSVLDHYPNGARTIPEFYAELIAMAEHADRLGFDTLLVAEHHFHEYGVVPNPAVMIAALAQRTRRLRLGTAIANLTYHSPLVIAENYAMADILSGGRLVLGAGSGYLKHEFAGFGIATEDKRQRFDETLTLVKRLLAGERVTHTGKFHKLEDVAINVRPIQLPAPPIYIAVLAREGAYYVGKQGSGLLAMPYASLTAVDEVGEMDQGYRRGLAEARTAAAEDRAIYGFHCYVAATDDEARRDASGAYDRYVESRLYARRHTYDDVLRSGLALFGSVANVATQVTRLHRMGLRHLALVLDFGLLPAERVQRSMHLFAEEVMPRVRAAVAGAR